MAYSAALDYLTRSSAILLYPAAVRWAWLTIIANAKRGIVRNLTPASLSLLARLPHSDAVIAMQIFTTCSADDPTTRLIPIDSEPDCFLIAPVEWNAWRSALLDSNARVRVEAFRERQRVKASRPASKRSTVSEAGR